MSCTRSKDVFIFKERTMEPELVIAQVLEELKQSVILINESLGSEKYDTSSISGLTLSAILDVCDVRIVDELPPLQTRADDLLVIPFEESQASQSAPQGQSRASNYIIVSSPGSVSTQNEATGGASWNYHDDSESTSEGSFLTEDEDDDDASDPGDSDMSDFSRGGLKSCPSSSLDKKNEGLLQLGASNCAGLMDKRGPGLFGESSRDERLREVFPLSLSPRIPLLCREPFADSQQDSGPAVPVAPTNILKRQLATDADGDARGFKIIRCDSHLPVGRDGVLY